MNEPVSSKWNDKNDSYHYGTPKPIFTWPAARINGQSGDWPTGHLFHPCLIPPPELTLVGTILSVGGAQIDLAPLFETPEFIVAVASAYAQTQNLDVTTNCYGDNMVGELEDAEIAGEVFNNSVFDLSGSVLKLVCTPNAPFAADYSVAITFPDTDIDVIVAQLSDLTGAGVPLPTLPAGVTVNMSGIVQYEGPGNYNFKWTITPPSPFTADPDNFQPLIVIISP